MDRIDTMEQFGRVMGTMVDDTDAVNDSMERMEDFLEGTSMRMDTMANSIQGFVTRGVDIEEATDTVQAWGNAVSFYGNGSSEQFENVADALQNMVAKGTVGMDQLNRVQQAGIPAVEIYADAVGKSSNEVSDALSSGAIDAEEFVGVVSSAMMEGTEKFPEISNAMVDQGSTWKSVMANIGNYVSIGVKDVIDSIDEMLEQNGLPDMRGMLDRFGRTFGDVISGVADKVPIATGYLVSMYEKAKRGIDWIKDTGLPAIREGIGFAVDNAKDMYRMIVDNWSLIGPVVAGVTSSIAAFKIGVIAVTKAKATWKAVTSAVQVATAVLNGTLAISPLGWVAIAIGAVVAAGIALYKNWDVVTEKAGALWGYLKKAFGDLKNKIVGWFSNIINWGVNMWQEFLNIKDKALNMASGMKSGILDMKDKVVGWFGDLKDGAVEKFDDIIQSA